MHQQFVSRSVAYRLKPGGLQLGLPTLQPQPVLLPWLHPGGVPPFFFQLALPWLKPAGMWAKRM